MNNKSSIDNRYLADDAMIERDERAASRKKKEKKVAATAGTHDESLVTMQMLGQVCTYPTKHIKIRASSQCMDMHRR